MKKSTIAIIICLTVAAISFSFVMIEFYPFYESSTFGSDVIDFEYYKKDFQTIVKWLSEKYGRTDIDLMVTMNKESGTCRLGKEDVPVEVSDEFWRIEDAFVTGVYLECVKIRGEQIYFCLWGKYDIVYSPSISPKLINGRGDRITVDKICNDWYRVRTITN